MALKWKMGVYDEKEPQWQRVHTWHLSNFHKFIIHPNATIRIKKWIWEKNLQWGKDF